MRARGVRLCRRAWSDAGARHAAGASRTPLGEILAENGFIQLVAFADPLNLKNIGAARAHFGPEIIRDLPRLTGL
jgi:hypothetical protein